MPPRIPVRFPWSSRTLNCSLNGSSETNTLCLRTFSSTPSSQALGPQSPNYIHVPKPLQPTYPQNPAVKGHLPIPRDIFKTRNDNPKHSDAFLDASTVSPKKPKQPGPYSKDAEYQLYKQRLAERRRTNLRSGVTELHTRKLATDSAFESKLAASYADKRARAFAPPLATDLLTATSVQKGIRDYLASTLPPSQKPARLPQRRARYAARIARQNAVRSSRLHDLYVNAREFMVEETQLDEAIEKVFGTEEQPIGWGVDGSVGLRSEGKEGLSPWHGPMPEGVEDMLQKLKGGEGVGLAKERARKVAEELTGGKM